MNVVQLATDLIPGRTSIEPWVDPVVDRRGHDPRSVYVERFWLSVIGPTATWVMRRFADEFDTSPEGFSIDLDDVARTMGLSYSKGQNSPFGRALHRCVMFGLAQPTPSGYLVRRKVPTVAQRHLRRLPSSVQSIHDDWARRVVAIDRSDIERRLIDAGIPESAAAKASEAVALAS